MWSKLEVNVSSCLYLLSKEAQDVVPETGVQNLASSLTNLSHGKSPDFSSLIKMVI